MLCCQICIVQVDSGRKQRWLGRQCWTKVWRKCLVVVGLKWETRWPLLLLGTIHIHTWEISVKYCISLNLKWEIHVLLVLRKENLRLHFLGDLTFETNSTNHLFIYLARDNWNIQSHLLMSFIHIDNWNIQSLWHIECKWPIAWWFVTNGEPQELTCYHVNCLTCMPSVVTIDKVYIHYQKKKFLINFFKIVDMTYC